MNGFQASVGAQRSGPIPLGEDCGVIPGTTGPCPEGGIPNGDFMTQVAQAQGQLWGGTATQIAQTYTRANAEIHQGGVYWVVGTRSFDKTGKFTLTSQGYVTAKHEDLEFPSIAATPTSGGRAIMDFTLNGNGGPTGADHGGFFPSSAFGRLTTTSNGLLKFTVNIANLGKSPQDGFTEYQGFPARPAPAGRLQLGALPAGFRRADLLRQRVHPVPELHREGVQPPHDRDLRRDPGRHGELGDIGQLRSALNSAAASPHRVYERNPCDRQTEDTIRPRGAGLVAAPGPGNSLLT